MTGSSPPISPAPPGVGGLDRVLYGVTAALLAVTLTLAFLQVVTRYVFHLSTPWSEELARLCFVWAVFLGAALGVRRNLHTRVDFVSQRLPRGAASVVAVGMDLLLVVMAAVMLVHGMQLVVSTRADFSTSLGYPRNWFYLPVPISGLLILGSLAPQLVRSALRRPREGGRRP